MAHNLRNIVLGSVASAALLLTGCQKANDLVNKTTGTETAYQKSVEIVNNPIKAATQGLSKDLEEIGLDNYFLQGKELEGLNIYDKDYFLTKTRVINKFPHVLDAQELMEFQNYLQEVTPTIGNIKEMGIGIYYPSQTPIEQVGLNRSNLQVYKFDNEKNEKVFLADLSHYFNVREGNDGTIAVTSGNVASIIFNKELPKSNLIEYAKRIGGKIYEWNSYSTNPGNGWHQLAIDDLSN